jgi:regulatory protein
MKNKITSIQTQKNNKERVNVFVDDEYAFSCDAELVYKYNLKNGIEVNLDFIKEIVSNDEFSKAKSTALKIFERSYKTEKEMIEKLQSRDFPDEVIQRVISFMKEYAFIDDEKYTQMYVKDKIKNRGRNRIKYDLLRKGVDEEIINNKINSFDSEEEIDIAIELGSKKYNSIIKREQDQRKIKQKLSQFLLSRGYTWDTINKVVRVLLKGETIEE